jgi:CubicO group peptidase (beta-lactamase class C family)
VISERTRSRAAALLDEFHVPSAQVGVLHGGHITDLTVGVTDVRTGAPATTDTIYQLGSMTKAWTALAFLQMAGEGRVSLDAPVRTWLPGFRVADPDTTSLLTPRHLLNHTNGIEEAYGDPGEGEDVYERMVANIADAPQVFPLGETHGYSAALGYAILARIMEVVDGKGWDAVMRDRLFRPLGLRSTSSRREDVDPGRAATGHVSLAPGAPLVPSPIGSLPRAYGPGGNIASTVRDVLTMAGVILGEGCALDGARLVGAGGVREMTGSRVAVPDPYLVGPWWGLGLTVFDWSGETVFAHDGSTIGQNARLRILPERGVAVAVLTNGAPRESFSRQVLDAVLADVGAGPVPGLPAPDPAILLDPSRYVGAYERPGTRYEVEAAADGGLTLTLAIDPWQARMMGRPARTTHDLLPINDTQFIVPARDALEDPGTVAIYGFRDGPARYLHTNARVHPRVDRA